MGAARGTTRLAPAALAVAHAEGIARNAHNGRFVDPRACARAEELLATRGWPWAESVLGRTFDRRSVAFPHLPWLNDGDPEILVAADAAETALEARHG
jgi:hypothetical protein